MKYGQPTHEIHDNISPQLRCRIDDGCLSPQYVSCCLGETPMVAGKVMSDSFNHPL